MMQLEVKLDLQKLGFKPDDTVWERCKNSLKRIYWFDLSTKLQITSLYMLNKSLQAKAHDDDDGDDLWL